MEGLFTVWTNTMQWRPFVGAPENINHFFERRYKMKRIILISILMMFISIFLTSGCMFEFEEERQARQAAMQQRAEVRQYLERMHPDTWADKQNNY
jgi:hypothetical protein